MLRGVQLTLTAVQLKASTNAESTEAVYKQILTWHHELLCKILTILQRLHSESCTVWSSPSSIDCCHLHRVAGEWSQSSQHMLSAPLSCSVHNGGAIAVAQSVSSDGSSLVRAGYCPPLHSQ